MKAWEAAYMAGIIDGEGSITLTRIHKNEHRRPCITISSTDKELLTYLQALGGGTIINKKNYKPDKHLNSYTLNIKVKTDVLKVLKNVHTFLRVDRKRKRALLVLEQYELVTVRNGKYSKEALKRKLSFEDEFFQL